MRRRATPIQLLAQKGGLFAAGQAICDGLREKADEVNINAGYLDEKLLKYIYFLGALMGFDQNFGNSTDGCATSALQQINASRRANILLLAALILLLTIPYWDQGSIQNALAHHFYPK